MDFSITLHGRTRFFRVQEADPGQRCTEDVCFAPATEEIVDRAPGHVGDLWLVGCGEHVGAEVVRMQSGAYADEPARSASTERLRNCRRSPNRQR